MKRLKIVKVFGFICAIVLIAGFFFIDFSAQRKEPASENPDQNSEEIYQIATLEDFEEFIRLVRSGETKVDAQLTADVYFNDISDFETWGQTPPEHGCPPMISEYGGTFDGDGYSLIGYYSNHHPIFGDVLEGACIRNLNIRSSYFAALYENRSIPEDDDTAANVSLIAGLCGHNYGVIENCTVEGTVLGDGTAAGVAVYNEGIVKDCSFSGRVEAGRCILRSEESLDIDRPRWLAGGIIANNYMDGTVSGCTNYGEITLYTGGMKIWRDTHGYGNKLKMESCAGGLAGKNNGLVENCLNVGNVSCARVTGGIAGANSGEIRDCGNRGGILLLPEDAEIRIDYGENEERTAAGISGYNTGSISDCYNAGTVSMEGDEDSGYVYGISQNISVWFDEAGECRNCYYLAGQTDQKYRYSGIYKLSKEEMDEIGAYCDGEKSLSDIEGYRTLYNGTNLAGTDEKDYIRLSIGPKEDMVYQVKAGDSLWRIAEDFYGDGLYYDMLEPLGEDGDSIFPGDEVMVPHVEYYLLRALDERAFGGVDAKTKADSVKTVPAFAKKDSAGWLYVYYLAETAGDRSMSVITPSEEESETWLRTEEEPAIFSSCIFFQVTSNEEGSLFAEDWKKAQERIRRSAESYLGRDCWGLRFYRYTLDNGENLYGYSFHCYAYQPGMEEKQILDCAVFYRMREGLLAEFIGVETHREESDLLAAVRYLAAIVDPDIDVVEGPVYDHSMYLGRENWAFPSLHNPFAIVKNG